MNLEDWNFCSRENDTISLHDCVINKLEWAENGMWIIFEDGFNVTKGNSLNPTGRHKLTGKAAVFLRVAVYLDGTWNKGWTQRGSGDSGEIPIQETSIQKNKLTELSQEVLEFTWKPDQRRFTLETIDDVGYCTLVFCCEEVWFCWNELLQDAWFQNYL